MARSTSDNQDEDGLLDGLTGLSDAELHERALTALRLRRFDLADKLLARGDLGLEAVVENLRVYQAELEIQNEELVLSQRQVQEGLARFTSLFNTLPIAELVIDRQGLIKEANLAAQALFNLRGSHLLHHFFARLIEERDRATVLGVLGQLADSRALVLPEIHFTGQGEDGFIGDLHIAPIPAGGDAPPQFVCGVVDRTEAVRQRRSLLETGEQLRQSEADMRERLKEFATLHDVLLETSQTRASVRDVLQHVAERLPAGFRYPELAEARIRLPEMSAATPGYAQTDLSLSAPIPLAGVSFGDVTLSYREPPNAREETPFLVEEQHLLESVATHLAVYLARIQDEERLRESRERYRVLAEFSSDWEYWLGPEGRYVYVSPACERISGHAADDFMADATLFARLILAVDRSVWDAHLKALADNQAADLETLEFRILARDGSEHWIEHICNPVLTEDGRFLGRRGVNRDITERKRFEEALKRSEDFLNATGRMAKVGGWEYDPAARTIRWTQGTLALLGISFDQQPGLDALVDLFDPRDRPGLQASVEQAIVCGTPFDMEARLTAERSEPTWVQITCEPFLEDDGVIKLLGAVQDITARVEAEKSLRQAARVFESTAEGVVITDLDDRVLAVNRAFTEITGYREAEVLGATPELMRSARHDAAFFSEMHETLTRTGQWRGEIWNRHKDGHVYPALLNISAVPDSAGEPTHYVGVFSDISQLKQSEERLDYLAHHDPLTGLPNRSLFQQRLESCLQRAKRYKRQFGLLFLDLDRFKEVNDTLGHGVGDALLIEVAEMLAKQVREVDTIARLGGDEFVIILEDIPASRFAATFADRLMETFSRPLAVQGRDLFITASIGISIYPDDGADMETLVRHADVAMYQTKNTGRNGFRFFETAMSEGAMERLRLEHDLRFAIQRAELVLHYQPQLGLTDGRLCGVEALCRWAHPELGQIPPRVFIPLAEEIGFIDELGFWVLEQSCRQVRTWDRAGFQIPRLAVNLSVRSLQRPGLIDRVGLALERAGLQPERLELEINESKIMHRADESIEVLRALRRLGITLAVDDFGTGYSSLAYLKRLPLNRLKIDGSFTDKLTQDEGDDAIVRAIIALARNMGLGVLGEGIETQAQADFLRAEGCLEGQGYLFSPAVEADALAEAWSAAL
ncbi:bifunctional diguanylate cyclase/phosphodiesterase [Thiocystis violacea]|uniref:bifunctional diguanylate cyclase/phosphodiesterase n=1 Tax=Thiocystis violacea TaxID=13725 RepID=UPI001905E479|nr:EAL domain-containing protein [Thiocystis violacea]MBK1722606.1 GGDEF domain-containing protein [Thiocystis violacea]